MENICEKRKIKPEKEMSGRKMWYVIQVQTGTEERIRLQCENRIPKEVLRSCFLPYYEEQRKIQGKWTTQKKLLFPGYVFAVTEQIEELYEGLKKIIGTTKLIGTGKEIVPLKEEEVRFLCEFGGEEHVAEMSKGIIEQSKVIITSGPLMGKEGYIRKIDRHKRKAWLEIEMFGRKQTVQAGLEIVAKTV